MTCTAQHSTTAAAQDLGDRAWCATSPPQTLHDQVYLSTRSSSLFDEQYMRYQSFPQSAAAQTRIRARHLRVVVVQLGHTHSACLGYFEEKKNQLELAPKHGVNWEHKDEVACAARRIGEEEPVLDQADTMSKREKKKGRAGNFVGSRRLSLTLVRDALRPCSGLWHVEFPF